MDNLPLVRMDALWPEYADRARMFEVVLTAPRADGGEPLVPVALPGEVIGCRQAETVSVSVTVMASRASGAIAAVEALVPDLAGMAGAEVTVRAVPA